MVERATGVEPATFSLGSYAKISNIKYLESTRHRLATSRGKYTRKNAGRLRYFFRLLEPDQMSINIQGHGGVFMAHPLLDRLEILVLSDQHRREKVAQRSALAVARLPITA